MSIRIFINGATGKMGQETVRALSQDEHFSIVGQGSRKDHLPTLLEKTKPEVVVDFTSPSVVYENVRAIIEAGARPVIGTTGLTQAQIQELQTLCQHKKLGGIIAPNFSLGAMLLIRFAREAAHYLPNVEIIEMHHAGKEDSPSGTALRTAEAIAESRAHAPTLKKPRETIPGARGATHHAVPIHAVRLPGFIAKEDVIFGGIGETLTLSHNSIHREAFMPGVCYACKKVMDLDHLVYGLENVLF